MRHLLRFDDPLSELYAGATGAAQPKKRKRRFETARELERRGTDMDAIRRQTGWFKSQYDGAWRFELTDKALRCVPICYNDKFDKDVRFKTVGAATTVTTTLGTFLSGTSLFQEYPQLRAMPLTFSSEMGTNAGGYDPERKEITLNQVDLSRYVELLKQMRAAPSSPATKQAKQAPLFQLDFDFENAVLHEVQHAIQDIEGFYDGSQESSFEPQEEFDGLVDFKRTFFRQHPDLETAWNKVRQLKGMGQQGYGYRSALSAYQELDQRYGYTQALAAAQDSSGGKRRTITAKSQYDRTAGEIEARDVEKRRPFDNKDGAFVLVDETGKVRYKCNDRAEAEETLAAAIEKGVPNAASWTLTTRKSREVKPYGFDNIEPHRAVYRKNGKTF